ncbi:hypothetical protein LJC01_02260 [Clostridiaceae bacterium OttesenSCG-928-D20]|nr:hypothetical protein [Clostridiaceae bacterium OttesenSCG-928-D20]
MENNEAFRKKEKGSLIAYVVALFILVIGLVLLSALVDSKTSDRRLDLIQTIKDNEIIELETRIAEMEQRVSTLEDSISKIEDGEGA